MAEVKKKWLSEIGSRIKERREELGITQAELADFLGIRIESLSYVENGKRDLKTAELAQLSERLSVSTDFLINGISPENTLAVEDLGLSERAINSLKEDKENAFVINRLLSSREFPELTKLLVSYFFNTLAINRYKSISRKRQLDFLFENNMMVILSNVAGLISDIFKAKEEEAYPFESKNGGEEAEQPQTLPPFLEDKSKEEIMLTRRHRRTLERLEKRLRIYEEASEQ